MSVKVKVKGKILYKRLGEKVYLARRRMGITQDKLAENTGARPLLHIADRKWKEEFICEKCTGAIQNS